MTTSEFAALLIRCYPRTKILYLAIMPSSDNSGSWDIEAELTHDTIGGVYNTDTSDVMSAQQLADDIEEALSYFGVAVVQSRDDWDEYVWSKENQMMVREREPW